MAAILPYIESSEAEPVDGHLGCAGGCSVGRRGLGSVDSTQDPSVAVAELTRLSWMREELTRLLEARTFHIGPKSDGTLAIYLDKDIPAKAIPWIGATKDHGFTQPYNLFAPTNTKMECPIFDLPSGVLEIGGTCPGAKAGQWIVDEKVRATTARAMLPPPGYPTTAKGSMPVEVGEAICSRCYASKGNYPSPFVQSGELVRYWWARECMMSAEGRREFVATMTEATLAITRRIRACPYKPVRIHSSGDFFSPAYYEAWVEVTERVAKESPDVRFWFPTRVWGFRGYDWSLIKDSPNTVIRASAYHMNDMAPEALVRGGARGSTAIYHGENMGMRPDLEAASHENSQEMYPANRERAERILMGEYKDTRGVVRDEDLVTARTERILKAHDFDATSYDPRYDWSCQTYAIGFDGKDLSHSCNDAKAPDGKIGCRACWDRPDLRICYTAH